MENQGLTQFDDHRQGAGAGAGFLRIMLLFGSTAVALGLILIPLLTQSKDQQLTGTLFVPAPDKVITGSVVPDSEQAEPQQ